MTVEYELTLADYLSILKRRAVLLVSTFAGILAVSLTIAIVVPPVYESTGSILVESQQIPVDLVAATITSYADERIEIIRQRVMTRENLMRIIDKYRLFSEDTRSLTVSEKIDEMRNAIVVSLVNANVKGKGQAAIAFKLSYEHRRAELAHRVANELVTLFLDENVKQRTERATETTEFLTQEADKLKVELEKVEGQLAAYKQEHGDALPQHQELRLTMLSRTEAELKEVERDYKAAQEELRFLDLELAAAKSGVTPKTGSPYGSAASAGPQDLGSLKAEYNRLLSLYKEAHPDVRAIKRKIEALESSDAQAKPEDKGNSAPPVSLEVARVQTKIAATQARSESLVGQIKTLRGKIGTIEKQILQTPQVERGLVTLMRDHESAQKKYQEIHTKQMSAKISENLEQENKAERFILLEPPLMPDKPVKPNRKKMAAMGFFLALAGSGGLVMMLETINQRVRGTEALTSIIRRRVLVTIPYISIQEEVQRRKRWIKRLVVIAIVGVLASLLLLHIFYMPLDILMMKVLARFD
jgi:succinoglycan biosynthesis transport protein ExoP